VSLVVLMSGGFDSSLAAAMAVDEGISVIPVFIDYGQRALERELEASRRICAQLGLEPPTVVDLSGFGRSVPSGLTRNDMDLNADAFLPGRNLLFLVAAASVAFSRGAAGVVIGLLDESSAIYPDQTASFVQAAERAIEAALGSRIKILTPLITVSKGAVMQLAQARGISETYSCHLGQEEPCGECIACREILNSGTQ